MTQLAGNWMTMDHTASGTAATTANVLPLPVQTVDGDILVVCFVWPDDPGARTVPSGWTVIKTSIAAGQVCMETYWKLASGEPPNYTWAWTTSREYLGTIHRLIEVDTTIPIFASGDATSGAGTSTSITVPGLTLDGERHFVFMFGGAAGASSATQIPTPMALVYNDHNSTTPGQPVAIEVEDQVAPGSRIIAIPNVRWTGQLIAFKGDACSEDSEHWGG